MRYATILVTILTAVVAPARAQDATARIKAAQYALGMIRGPQRIDAINTMEYWGTGTDGRLAAKVTCHVSLSYFTPAMRVDVMRDPGARQIQVVSGNFAWDESVPGGGFIPGTTATPAPAAVKDRLLQLWSTPHGALKAAERAASNAKVTKENGVTAITFPMTTPLAGITMKITATPAPAAVKDRLLQLWSTPHGALKAAERAASSAKVTKENGATAITFPMTTPLAGITMKITLNASDHVEKVETRTESGTVTETTYSDYKDLGEIQSDVLFPLHITQKQGGVQVLDLTITKTDPNNPYVVFPVPESVEKPK